jgi:hypothetical protein
MTKRYTFLIIGSIFVLTLSGCMNISVEIWHNPDGSGRILHQQAFTEDFFVEFGLEGDLEEAKIEFLEEAELKPEHLPEGPNIKRITADTYFDPASGDLVTFFDMDVYEIVGLTALDDKPAGSSDYFIIIENKRDGTYVFSQYLKLSIDEISAMGEPDADHNIREMLSGQYYTLMLHAQELIESDEFARYDGTTGVIIWEIPMADVLLSTTPIELFAVYRLTTGDTEQSTQPDPIEAVIPTDFDQERPDPAGFLQGLPNWVPYVTAGLCCLTLLAAVVAVVVIVIIGKRKKKTSLE